MVKKPKSLRIKAKAPVNDNEKLIKCHFCKEELQIDLLIKIDDVYICDSCLDEYCQICKETKPYITVRRDFNDKTQTHQQVCSDCYLMLCQNIVTMDSEYDSNNLDKKKAGTIDDMS